MPLKDRIYEELEDKKLELLLQEYAEEEGHRLIEENNRLRENPNYAVPEAFGRACQEAIEKAAKQEKRKVRWSVVQKSLKRVAVVAIVLCLTGGTLFCTVDAFRFYILNTFSSNSETNTRIDVTELPEDMERTNYISKIWLPDGYSHSFSDYSTELFQIHCFRDSDGNTIELVCMSEFSGTYNVDDENADKARDVMVNGNAARLITKDKIQLSWFIPELSIWCNLISELSVSEDEMIKVAESIG